jgi:ribonuclease D
MRPATLIETPADFRNLLDTLAGSTRIAIDTESNSFHAYYDKICLIQISTEGGDYVVDPLAIKDVGHLGEILREPGIEKIFHAASNDLIGLKRDLHCCPQNIFDTAVAAKLLGIKKLGLARILNQYFGVSLNKKWQRHDWGKRPLQPEQIDYARMDTHYLIALRDLLASHLIEKDLWQDAQDAFARICSQEAHEKVFQPNGFIHLKGAQSLDSRSRRILKDLYHYREHEAKRRNRAPFRILSNETLVRLAHEPPTSINELTAIKGLPRSYQNGRAAHLLLELIQRTHHAGDGHL